MDLEHGPQNHFLISTRGAHIFWKINKVVYAYIYYIKSSCTKIWNFMSHCFYPSFFYISWAWSILFCSSPFWTYQIFIWSSFNKDMMFSSSFQISLTISLKLTAYKWIRYSQLCFRWCVFFYKNAPTETQFAAVNVSTV